MSKSAVPPLIGVTAPEPDATLASPVLRRQSHERGDGALRTGTVRRHSTTPCG